MLPRFSICIPAYQRPQNIARLLQSISIQTFSHFEIIITDDSPDASVKEVIDNFSHLPISYIKNEKSLGTPANWNRAISLAKGEWIKLMHDDDWFRNENSLQRFADKANSEKAFIFSGFVTVFESGEERKSRFPSLWRKKILKHPMVLLAQNIIGTPSATLVHRSFTEQYDERMKWRVDIDYYIRLLKKERKYELIEEPLVNVGMSEGQVTNSCINKPEFELPEGLLLLQKNGLMPLRQVMVYDAWWRILRNTGTRNTEQLHRYATYGNWPEAIIKIVNHQSKFPGKLLQVGVLSKVLMFFSYLLNRKHLRD